jgi:hypothetical protein
LNLHIDGSSPAGPQQTLAERKAFEQVFWVGLPIKPAVARIFEGHPEGRKPVYWKAAWAGMLEKLRSLG